MASLEYVCRTAPACYCSVLFFFPSGIVFLSRCVAGAVRRSLGSWSEGCGVEIDRVTRAPELVGRVSCRTTTLVNRAPILMDTLQQHTARHPDPTRLIPTLQPLSPDMAQHGLTTPTCLRSIGPRRRLSPEVRQSVALLRAPPIEGPVSQPRTLLRPMRTR